MKEASERSVGHDGKNKTRTGRSNSKANRSLVPTPRKTDVTNTKPLSAANIKKRDSFYKELAIDPVAVVAQPRISHIIATIPGGIHQAIQFLYGSEEPEARAFAALHDSIMAQPNLFDCLVANLIPFEAFCVKLGVTSKRMLEVVMGACFEQSHHASHLMAAASQPMMVEATIKAAIQPEGHADRKLMHQHSRFIPTPKNTFVAPGASYSEVNDNSIGRTGHNQTVAVSELPRIETKMQKIADRFNERMGIASASAPPALAEYGVEREEFGEEIEVRPDPIEIESEAVLEEQPLEPTESDWSV